MKTLQKPHVYWTIGIFLIYTALNVWLSEFYITIRHIPNFVETINWAELAISLILSTIIGILVAFNTVYAYLKYKEHRQAKTATAATCLGTVAGLSTGVCAACVTSVFPAILGLFGVTLSWAALPFRGAEIQILTILLLGVSLYVLTKK